MFLRPSPLAARSRAAARALPPLPLTTSEELVAALVAAGGHVLAQQAHGVMVAIRKRLVFVPPSHWVSEATLRDALLTAGLSTERFLALRGAVG